MVARIPRALPRNERAPVAAAQGYRFRARLERLTGVYAVRIPAAVSRAIGKRGNVPVVAVVNGRAEVRASLVPCGGGRHRLGLNAAARKVAGVEVGASARVELRVDPNPVAEPMAEDVAQALDEAGVLATFRGLPVGKQSHILRWIEQAAREATRVKRIGMAVEVALRKREKGETRGKPGA